MVRNERLIDPTAGAVRDSAPARCHVGNQVLRSRRDPSNRASERPTDQSSLSSLDAIARNKLRRRGGRRRDGRAEFLSWSRARDAGGRGDQLHGSMPRIDQLRFTIPPRVICAGEKTGHSDAREMQLPRDADRYATIVAGGSRVPCRVLAIVRARIGRIEEEREGGERERKDVFHIRGACSRSPPCETSRARDTYRAARDR